MFKAIIHNLHQDDEAQIYNNLIARKPTGNVPLAEKILAQRQWKNKCEIALQKVKEILK